jgi:hypothetical protein
MIGELAALGAALTWAIAPLLYRKALTGTSPISANIVRNVTNAVVLLHAENKLKKKVQVKRVGESI